MTLAEILHPRTPPPTQTLWEKFEEACWIHGDQIAINVLHQKPDHLSNLIQGGVADNGHHLRWTHRNIRDAGLAVAASLARQGVPRGSTLVTLIDNGVEALIRIYTAAVLQLTVVPLDPDMATTRRAHELEHHLKSLSPAAVLVANPDRAKLVDETVKKTSQTLEGRLICSGAAPGWHGLSSISPRDPMTGDMTTQDKALDKNGQRTGIILFTSGTSSGQPKGCLITVQNQMMLPHMVDSIREHTVMLMTSVNFRAIFCAYTLACGLVSRELVIAAARPSVPTTLDAIEWLTENLFDITVSSVAGTVKLYANDPELMKRNKNGVKVVRFGGDILTEDLINVCKKVFPNADVMNGWGMTEGSSVTTVQDEKTLPRLHGIVSVGRLQHVSSARVVDPVDGKTMNRGEIGDYHVSGPGMISGYLQNAKPEDFYDDSHGRWLRTGDHVVMNENGFIFVLGRTKDVIKKLGLKLSPAVLERVLNSQPGIDAQVISMPHDVYGQVPVAVVRERNGNSVDSIKQAVSSSMSPDYVLEDVVFLDELGLDAFPRNPSGKILKNILQEKVSDLRGCGD